MLIPNHIVAKKQSTDFPEETTYAKAYGSKVLFYVGGNAIYGSSILAMHVHIHVAWQGFDSLLRILLVSPSSCLWYSLSS